MRRKTTLACAVLLALLVCSIIPRAVLAAAHGDFNGDGKISSQDAVWMLRHVLEPQGDAADQSSDFNGDGKVDTQDALYLLRYALRPEAYPLVENHDPVELPGKAATCTEPGLMAGMICRVCEKVLQEQTELPALGHSYEQGVCTRCGEMKISRELQMELLPDGSGYAVVGIGGCTDTGIVVPDTHQGLPVTTVSSQAFTGSGITSVMLGENICIIESCAFYGCGELKEIVILAEEVVFGGSTIVHDCRNLETVYFSGDPVRWARDGFYLDDEVRLILNYGHDYAGESLCPESCTDGGMIRYTCRDCGRSYEQQTQALGHSYVPEDRVEPTCTEDGIAEGICTRCGQHTSQVLPALGHNIGSYNREEEPGCVAAGSEVGICSRCRQSVRREVPAVGHTVGTFVGTGEFCGDRELGSAACTVCGQVVYAVEHLLHTQTQLPTCTEAGYRAEVCSNCTYRVTTTLAAAGHSAGTWKISREATCTAEGEKLRTCTGCDAVVDTAVIPVREHILEAVIDGGICTYTCRDCGHTESVAVENKLRITLVTGCEPELPVIYAEAGQVPQLPIPVLGENVFLGWYLDVDGTVPYENIPVTEDMTLYALWGADEITAADEGLPGIVYSENTDYQFAVKSPFALTDSNVNDYITVTSGTGQAVRIHVANGADGLYHIGGDYMAGDIYEATAVGGVTFVESGEDPLWFVIDGPEREIVETKEGTVTLREDRILSKYSSGGYDYVLTGEDLLDVGQMVLVTGERDEDLRAVYEIVGESAQGAFYCYQCAVPDPADVISQVRVFGRKPVDMSKAELPEDWEETVIQSVRSSKAYAAFREAAGVYAQSRSDQKYTYKLRDFEIKAKVKSGWSNNTQRTELVLLIEIGCKMERKENSTGKIVDVSNLSMTMERRFGADASISADGILEGDARVVLTTHSTLTVDFVLKKGLMDSDDAQEEYFRNLYKNACDKKDLLPIDTIPTGQETLIPAFYVPIPLPMGFALDVNVYLVLDWEACGEFGVTYQHVNTMSFGFALNDWDFSGVGYSSNRYSMNAYLAGKIRASAGIRPEFGLSWMKVLRVGANTTVSAYAEVGGMVGFTVSSTQKIRPLWGGYVGCGVELDARVFGEVGVWPFNYKLDYVLMSKDIEFFGLGTKEMPLGFEQDGEEYVLSMDYEQPVQLKDRVNMMARVQDLGTMEIDRKAAKDCRFTLIAPQKYVQLNPDGSLAIRGCDITDFDLEIRITSGVVYKDITVHVTVDHRHEYETTYFAGDCTHDEHNVHRCTRCSYVYEEILTVAPGHDYSQSIVDKEPTCTADGKRHGTCVRCGYTGTEAIPKLGHDYSVQLPEDAHLYRPATCQGAAWYYYVCANCGGHSSRYTYEYGPLGDHSYADPFTCHDRPCTTRNCSHISEASTEHPWTAWIPVEPGGCAVEPYSIRACRDCGLTENDLGSDHVQAHEPELLPGLEPTCYEPGYQDYVICSVCGAELNKTELAPLEHNILYRAITETTHVEYCHRRGCDYESGPIGHIHTGWTQTQAPTCETDGREEAVCVCGHRKSRIIKAPGHTKVTDPAVAPTCTEEGLTEGAHCGVCGRILAAQQPVAATGHTFDQKKTTDTYKAAEATCTEPASYYYSCICGEKGTETFRGGDVRPHTFDQQKATDEYRAGEATCTEPETYYYSCICGAKGTQTFTVGEPLPHTFDRQKVTDEYRASEATCTEPASYYYSCVCGAKGTETFRSGPLGDHRFDQQKATDEYRAAEATCTEAATYYMSCICGEKGTQTFRYGDPVPHTPGAPADCVHARTCTVCGTVLEQPKGHVDGPVRYDEKEHWTVCGRDGCGEILRRDGHTGRWLVEESSTCVTRGTEVYRCGCGYENTRKLELADHDHSGDWQSDGRQHYRICPDCGQSIDAADHRGGEYQPDHAEEQHCRICTDCSLGYDYGYHIPVPNGETKAPTCTEEGYTPYRCELCGWEWKGDVVSAGGHRWSDTPDFDEQYHFNVCSVCGKQDLNNREKHTLDEGEVIREATCTEPGIVRFGCVFCDYEEEKSKDPDHDHSGKWVNTESGQHYRICGICNEPIDHEAHKLKTDPHEPDCENPGYDQHTCTDCGYSYRDNESEALGHSGMDEWQIDKRTGEHYRACDRDGCGYEADRAGHAYGAWRTIVEPTCREFGKQEHSCEVCGHTESDDLNKLPHDTYETVETTPKPVSGGTVYEHALVERCRNCDYSQKLGENCVSVHDTLRFRNEVPATCTEPGLTTGWECAYPGCDNSCHDRQQKPIPALGHDFLDGWCTRCGAQSASEGLEFTLSDDGTYYIVTGIGTCTDTELVIPGTHQGLPVREIGEGAFADCTVFTSVTISDSVTEIGPGAFNWCSSLERVTIPDSVTEIGPGAFCWCRSLDRVTLPQGLTAIHYSLFTMCVNLTEVNIPAGVTSIGDQAFMSCHSLTELEIPAGVTSIGDHAFSGCGGMTELEIPGGITSIGDGVFSGCIGLTELVLPEGITSIGDYAFSGCSGLTELELPAGVTSIGDEAFRACSGLTELVLPEGITSIGYGAFSGCSGLTELIIPGGVTSIGYRAFYGCSGLTELEIPGGITSIGGQAFKNCHALKTIYFEGTQALWDTVVKGEGWNDNSPVQVICLGGAATSEGLEFTLSDDGTYYTVTGIGTCTDTELVIPGTHQGLPVREIGDHAFFGCSGLESIAIPEGVTAIGVAAFSRCPDLAQVTLPKGLTTIRDGAFGFCTSLRTITIPQGVTTIGNWVFENCSSLEKIELPKGVTTIGDFAFQYCSGLTVVTMPARVTRIGVLAFLDCTALETIYFEGTQAQWDAVEKRSGWNDGCPAQVICLGGAAASQGMGSPGSKDRGPRVGACSMDCAP